MRGEWTRCGPAVKRLEHRRFHFDEATRIEKTPQRLHHAAALHKYFAHLRVHEHVRVALAIAQLDVGQAMPLLGQRQQRLCEEGQLVNVDGEFASLGAKQVSARANVITDIEQLVELEAFFPDRIFLDVNLKLPPALLQKEEGGLAHSANRHDAPGDVYFDALRLKLLSSAIPVPLQHLWDGVRGLIAIRIRLLA